MYHFIAKINGQSIFKKGGDWFIDAATLDSCELIGSVVYEDKLFSPLHDENAIRLAGEIEKCNTQLHKIIICEFDEPNGEPVITIVRQSDLEQEAPKFKTYCNVLISQITDEFADNF